MSNDDDVDRKPRRVESDRSRDRFDSSFSAARARDRIRVRTAFAVSAAWGAAFFGFPNRQPPPELSAAFFAAIAYLLGTRTPED